MTAHPRTILIVDGEPIHLKLLTTHLSQQGYHALTLLHRRLKYGVSVELETSPELEIRRDRQKISQVFVNLINYSADAMEGGNGQIHMRGQSANGRIEIQVRDSGSGIAADVAGKIFDPFFTTKGRSEGIGIGLFIARRIVEEHQGEISLSPEEGRGSQFNIVFPVLQ